jgi:hypothetical protein
MNNEEDISAGNLSAEDRQRVNAQVDHFIDVISRRYGIKPSEVIDTIVWVRERREFTAKVTMGGALAIIGILATALAFSMWEGIKHFLLNPRS